MRLTKALLLMVLTPGALGQITFPLPAPADCSSLPAQCQCAGMYVTCACLDQGEGLVLRQQHFAGRIEERVAVSNCANTTISGRTFTGTRVQALVLANISALTLEQHALQLSYERQKRFTVIMTNVSTLELPSQTFSTDSAARAITRIDEFNTPKVILVLNDSDVRMAASNFFGNVRVHDMDMFANAIEQVQAGFLNNTVEGTVNIIGNTFSQVDNDAFLFSNDSSLPNELNFKYNNFSEPLTHFLTASAHFNIEVCNNSFPLMLEAPWSLHAREDVVVENNNFTNLPALGLDVSAGARISFSFNYVGIVQRHALMAVTTEESSTLLQLAQNRFSSIEDASLQLPENLTTQAVFVRDNIFEEPCTCANTSSTIMRAIGAYAPIPVIRNNERQQPWVLLSLCQALHSPDQEYIQVSVFISRQCAQADLTTTIFLSVFGSLLIVLACCVVIAWRRLKHKHLHATHSSSAQPPYPEVEAEWSRVVPEKQAYRNRDIREIVEKAKQVRDPNIAVPRNTSGYTNNAILELDEGLPTLVSTHPPTTKVSEEAKTIHTTTTTNTSGRKGGNAPVTGSSDVHAATAEDITHAHVQQEAGPSQANDTVAMVDKTGQST